MDTDPSDAHPGPMSARHHSGSAMDVQSRTTDLQGMNPEMFSVVVFTDSNFPTYKPFWALLLFYKSTSQDFLKIRLWEVGPIIV